MNKKSIAFLSVLMGVVFMGTSCAGDPASVGKTVTATRAYGQNKAEYTIDGDLTTGWVSSGPISETYIPMLSQSTILLRRAEPRKYKAIKRFLLPLKRARLSTQALLRKERLR